MLTRAIIVIALCLGLGAPAWADKACITQDQMIGYFQGARPGMQHVIYTGLDSEAIKSHTTKAGTSLDGKREFVVFSHPEIETILVAGFKDGCFEAQMEMTREKLDNWLAGVEG